MFKIIEKLLLSALLIVSMSAQADTYRVLIPFPAGNQADAVLRSIQAAVERNTNDRLTIINMPGAETIVASNHFVSNRQFDAIMTTASQVIWNPLFKSDLVRYKDSDLRHLSLIGTTHVMWVTNVNSGIRNIDDLVTKMPVHVGGFATSHNLNLEVLVRKYKQNSKIISYKGTNEVLMDLLNETLKIGLVTPSQVLFQHVKSGKLHIVGTTGPDDMILDDVSIPSVTKKLQILNIPGFMGFATHADMDPVKAEKIKNLLWIGITDSETQRILRSLYVTNNHTNDHQKLVDFFQGQQRIAREFIKSPIVSSTP